MSKKKLEILRDKFLKYHLEYKNEEMLFEIIDKLQKENEALKEKLHEKNMQIIKLNELLAEGIDMSNEENSNQPKI